MRELPARFQTIQCSTTVLGVGVLGVILCALALPAGATESMIPWECSGFIGEAQNRCIRALTQLQQEKIAKLEQELEAQRQTVQHLEQQVSQQTAATGELVRQLTDNRVRWYGSSSVQIYPPLGLSLRFGRDRFWGGSLWYGAPRYWGPRFYGHGHRRWHRH